MIPSSLFTHHSPFSIHHGGSEIKKSGKKERKNSGALRYNGTLPGPIKSSLWRGIVTPGCPIDGAARLARNEHHFIIIIARIRNGNVSAAHCPLTVMFYIINSIKLLDLVINLPLSALSFDNSINQNSSVVICICDGIHSRVQQTRSRICTSDI